MPDAPTETSLFAGQKTAMLDALNPTRGIGRMQGANARVLHGQDATPDEIVRNQRASAGVGPTTVSWGLKRETGRDVAVRTLDAMLAHWADGCPVDDDRLLDLPVPDHVDLFFTLDFQLSRSNARQILDLRAAAANAPRYEPAMSTVIAPMPVLGDLLCASDIARRAGVSKQVVCNWARRHPDFPAPMFGKLRAWSQVEHWLATRGVCV